MTASSAASDPPSPSPMELADVVPLPRYSLVAARTIAAPAEVVWEELLALPMSALPRGFALSALRHLPAVLAGREKRIRGGDTFLDTTPIPVIYRDAPRRVIAAGLSQPWKVFGGDTAPAATAAELRNGSWNGWITVAMSYDLEETAEPRRTRLSIETRIGANDPATDRKFAPYWRLIEAGSVLVRQEVVSRTKKRAEARSAGANCPPPTE